MAVSQAGAPAAVARPGSVLAQRKCASFCEPRKRPFLKCPNLDLLGGGGRTRGAAPRLKAPRGHPRRCLLRGAVGADHLLRADAAAHPVSVALRSSNLQGFGNMSNTLAPRAPMELGICCSIALLCCTNTSDTCVAPGESTLHACSPASLHLVCTHAAGSADGTKDDGRSGGLTISRSSDSGPPGSC